MVEDDPSKKNMFEDIKIKFDLFGCLSEDFVDALGNRVLSIHQSITVYTVYVPQMVNYIPCARD
jgi:hypothetical protein